MTIEETIEKIQPLNQTTMQTARERQDQLTKPRGSLGRLEELSIQLAGIYCQPIPIIKDKVIVTMAGDHGVVAEGVSAFPQEVTSQMVLNFLRGGAAINVLARHVGAHGLDRAGGGGAGRERRGLPGTVPQPAGRPVPDRRGFGRGAGRGHRHEHPLAVLVLGLDGDPAGRLPRRAADRLHRLQPGARRTHRPDHQPDPGGRGVFLLRHLPDLVPDAAFDRRSAPRAGLAVGRHQPGRLGLGA